MQRQQLAAVGSSAVLCGPSPLLGLLQHRKSSLAGDFQLGNVLFDSSVHQLEINIQVLVHQDVPESSQPFQSTDGWVVGQFDLRRNVRRPTKMVRRQAPPIV